jgi:hypothetical protein
MFLHLHKANRSTAEFPPHAALGGFARQDKLSWTYEHGIRSAQCLTNRRSAAAGPEHCQSTVGVGDLWAVKTRRSMTPITLVSNSLYSPHNPRSVGGHIRRRSGPLGSLPMLIQIKSLRWSNEESHFDEHSHLCPLGSKCPYSLGADSRRSTGYHHGLAREARICCKPIGFHSMPPLFLSNVPDGMNRHARAPLLKAPASNSWPAIRQWSPCRNTHPVISD